VEEEGVKRWLAESGAEALARLSWQQGRQRAGEFRGLLAQTRERLALVYAGDEPDEVKRVAKAQAFGRLQADYAQLKTQWDGFAGYDRWMGRELNNAHLAGMQTYSRWVPALQRLLADLQGDMRAFHARCEQLASLDGEQRRAVLQELQANGRHHGAGG
jgi:predicted aminopeptidase